MEKVIIYTDGSSRGNPGPGGWGAIIFSGENVRELGERDEHTTNNRMELTAAIKALEDISSFDSAQDKDIEIHTDSEYLMKGITIWIKNWQRNNWRTKDRKDVLNKDLWLKLFELTENKKIEWKKVLGHSGHELNERCDEIATSFADGKNVNLYDGPKENYKFNL
jgi:ribonuclease HI